MFQLLRKYLLTALLCFSVTQSYAGSYVIDGSGNPVRDMQGVCVKSNTSSLNKYDAVCEVKSRVTLLPAADGSVGALLIQVGDKNERIETAYAGVSVGAEAQYERVTSSANEVKARFSSLLNSQPQSPEIYIVRFETGSDSELTPDSFAVIELMLSDLSKRSVPEIRITGHSDTVGSSEINDRLSKSRAQTVADLLVDDGFSAGMLEVTGRGERQLAVATGDNVDEPANRRVEITVR